MSKQGRYQRQVPKKRTSSKKIAVIIVCALLAVILSLFAIVFVYAQSKLNKITRAEYATSSTEAEETEFYGYMDDEEEETLPPETSAPETEPTEPDPTEPDYGKTGKIVNILLIGQDSRPGEDSKLADTIMLVTVNKETKKLTVTSFLRDMFVKMPNYVEPSGRKHDCGKTKINANYAMGYKWAGDLGAMELMDQCIYENFGVEIDGNIEVSFDAFVTVVDALGGIDMELNEDEAKYMTDLAYVEGTFEPGIVHMDGWTSLAYARMRHSNAGDSDIKRAGRQRIVINKVIERCRSMNLAQMNRIIDAVLPMVITDMENSEIMTLAMELVPLLPFLSMDSNQCPADGTYHGEYIDIYHDGFQHSVLVPDVGKNRQLLMEICEG